MEAARGRRRDPQAILKITNTRGEVLETADANPGRQVLGPNGEISVKPAK